MYSEVNITALVRLQNALLSLFSSKKPAHPRVHPRLRYIHIVPPAWDELWNAHSPVYILLLFACFNFSLLARVPCVLLCPFLCWVLLLLSSMNPSTYKDDSRAPSSLTSAYNVPKHTYSGRTSFTQPRCERSILRVLEKVSGKSRHHLHLGLDYALPVRPSSWEDRKSLSHPPQRLLITCWILSWQSTGLQVV